MYGGSHCDNWALATDTAALVEEVMVPAHVQLLGACCLLRSAGWTSSCVRRSSELKQFR